MQACCLAAQGCRAPTALCFGRKQQTLCLVQRWGELSLPCSLQRGALAAEAAKDVQGVGVGESSCALA